MKETKNSDSLAQFCAQIEVPVWRKTRPEPMPVLTADELFLAASDASLSVAQKVRFRKKASDEEKKKLAEYAVACDTSSVKTTLLSIFDGLVFPISCQAIIKYAHAEDLQLRVSAITALEKCRGEEVRKLAFELLPQKEYAVSALARRNWLTMDMVKECLHDSNEDIRSYVTRICKSYT